MPNGAEEKFRWGDRREPPFFYFYKERLGTGSPPHPTRLRRPTFPPRGRLWGWELPFPTTTPTSPSPPSRGAGRYGRRIQGRRPVKKRRRTPAGSPQPEKVGPGRKKLFLPGVLSSGFLPKKAGLPRRSRRGNPRRRAYPAPVQKAPKRGRAGTTPQVWTCAGQTTPAGRPHRVPTVSRAPWAASAGDFFRPLGRRSLAASHTTRGVRPGPGPSPNWLQARGTTERPPGGGGASLHRPPGGAAIEKGLVHGLVGQNPSRNRGVVSLRTSKAWKSWLKVRVAKAMVLATAKVPVRWNPRP